MSDETNRLDDDGFFPVSPLTLFPQALGRFKVFIRQAGRYVLYAGENEPFTERHRRKLHEHGMSEVYVRLSQREGFNRYLERNLPMVLEDESLPLPERGRVFHAASTALVRDVFENRLPAGPTRRDYARISSLAAKCVAFLAKEGAFRSTVRLLSRDYGLYTHGVQVFVYSTAILQSMGYDEELTLHSGVGALLHDIGKTALSRDILDKPGPLTPEERLLINTHPVKGVALSLNMGLPHAASGVILLHHERMNGQGYPGGVSGEHIPAHVRAVTAADVYDALTTKRPYADAVTPFEALKIMRDDMTGTFDLDIYKRLVMLLSGANLV